MLMTIKEAADLLRTTPGAARGVLERLSVRPINLGTGRGLGLRWYKHEIVAALDDGRKPRKKPVKAIPDPFAGKSTDQLMGELTASNPVQ
ncbi:MAG: hypothetical protein RBR42_04890 [Desulfomicrobium sp.]|nr:hypothetical protein [Desulfomicrobium sp.]